MENCINWNAVHVIISYNNIIIIIIIIPSGLVYHSLPPHTTITTISNKMWSLTAAAWTTLVTSCNAVNLLADVWCSISHTARTLQQSSTFIYKGYINRAFAWYHNQPFTLLSTLTKNRSNYSFQGAPSQQLSLDIFKKRQLFTVL